MASLVNTTVTSAAGSGVALAVTGGNDLVDNILLNLLNQSGSTVLNIRNNGALYGTNGTFSGSVYLTDANTRIHEGSGNSVRITTGTGYIDVGSMNATYAHFQTDRGRFYFNKELVVDTGIIRSYNEDLQFDASYDGAVAKNIILRTGNVEKVRMNTDGNVGIGTNNPGKLLQLEGGGLRLPNGYSIDWNNENTRILASHTSQYIRFDVGGTSNVMYATPTYVSFNREIIAGTSATGGGSWLEKNYSGSNKLNVLSSKYSSGNTIIGYGAKGKSSSGGTGYVATYGNFSGKKSVIELSASTLYFKVTDSAAQDTIGDDITLNQRLAVDKDGMTYTSSNGTGLLVRRTSSSAYLQFYPSYSNVPTIMGKGAGGLHLSYSSSTSGIRIDTSNNVIIKDNILFFGSTSGPFVSNDSTVLRLAGDGGVKIQTYVGGWQDRLTIIDNGNVGINNTNPSAKLHIGGSFSDAANDLGTAALAIKQTSTSAENGIYIERTGERKGYYIGIAGVDGLTFRRNFSGTKSDIMSLTRDGNVGINTTSPSAKLHIQSDGSHDEGAEIVLRHSNNNSTDVVSTLSFQNNGGQVAMIQAGTTSGNTNGYISFFTDNAGTSAEAMRIDSNHRVQLKATDYQLRYTSGSHIWYNRLTSSGTFAIHKNGVGDYLSVSSAGTVTVNNNLTVVGSASLSTDGSWVNIGGANVFRKSAGFLYFGNANFGSGLYTRINIRMESGYNISPYSSSPSSSTTLGTSLRRWPTIYCVAGNFSGNVTSPNLSNKYNLPNTSGSASWIKLGNLSTAQSGRNVFLRIVSASGYNAAETQNTVVDVYFRTSNGSSSQTGDGTDGGSFYGSASSQRYTALGGNTNSPSVIRIVQVSNTSYDFYGSFNTFTGTGSFYEVSTDVNDTWTNSSTTVSEPTTGTLINTSPVAISKGAGSANRVAVWDGTNSLTYDTNLYWDFSNDRLGIGGAPSTKLHVIGGQIRANEGTSGVAIGEYQSGAVIWLDGANGDFTGGDYYNIRANNSAQLTFGYAGGESLYLTALGDLGLGAGAPAAKFHINNTSDKKTIYLKSSSGGPSTHYPLQIEANNLTSAGCAYFYSNASSTDTRKLVYINNDHASATGTTCLRIKQDSTGTCLHFDTSTGIAMYSTDADIWGVVGRAKFGHMGHADYAGFSHRDTGGTGNYALLQSSTGATFLNAASGQTIYFRVNNSDTMYMTSTQLQFNDNKKVILGNDSDLQIYHDGSDNHSYIKESGSGHLYIQATNLRLQSAAGGNILEGVAGGVVRLYHNDVKKLETTSTGVTITGTATATTFSGSGSSLTSLNATQLTSGTVPAARLGNVTIASSATDILSASSGSISADDAGADKIVFWDDSASKLTYLTVGSNLSISGTTISASGGGGGGGMTSWIAEDGDGTEVTISDGKYLKFKESTGIDVNLTDTSSGTSGDPYDMTIKVSSGVCMGVYKGGAGGTVNPSSNFLTFTEGTGIGMTFSGSEITFSSGTSSDYRLKKNISTFNSEAWTKVKSVNLRKYDFDEDAFKVAIDSPDKEIDSEPKDYTDNLGFIAHELAEAGIKGAVIGDKDGVDENGNFIYQKVNYISLVPVLWGALNEAISKIETLESKVQALEDK